MDSGCGGSGGFGDDDDFFAWFFGIFGVVVVGTCGGLTMKRVDQVGRNSQADKANQGSLETPNVTPSDEKGVEVGSRF